MRGIDVVILGLRIGRIASHFNGHARVERDAPRRKTITDELERLGKASIALAKVIDLLGDTTLELLHSDFLVDAKHRDLAARAGVIGLPFDADEIYPEFEEFSDDRLTRVGGYLAMLSPRLNALAELANHVRRNFTLEHGLDRGGRGNIFLETSGPAKWHLARECFALLDDLEEPISGGDDGLFSQFVHKVFDYATGDEADQRGVGLSTYIRDAAVICGERKAAVNELDMIKVRRANKLAGPNADEREQELVDRLSDLSQAMQTGRRPGWLNNEGRSTTRR